MHTFICKYIQGTYEVGGFSFKKSNVQSLKNKLTVSQNPILKYFIGAEKCQLPTFTMFSSEACYSILHIFLMSSCDVGHSECRKGGKLAWFSAFLLQIHCPPPRDKVKGDILYMDTLCILAFGTQNLKCKNYCYDKNKRIRIREF